MTRFAQLGLDAAAAAIRGDVEAATRHLHARDEILRLQGEAVPAGTAFVARDSEKLDPGQAVLLCALAQTSASLAALGCARRTFTDIDP